MPLGETIVALATPVGESAIALIRLSGPACPELGRVVLGRREGLVPRRATLGGYRDLQGQVLDQVLATAFEAPGSYTGEAVLELACHGNPFIVQRILEDLQARGCRPAEPGEFTRTAFLNGRMDLSQAEAVADLIRARSDRALAIAQRQLSGALGRKISELTDRVLQVAAVVEAYIDFPEEDLPPEDREGPARGLLLLAGELEALMATARYRELLNSGVRTVIVGAPNAGKSSLLNALAGRDRAIVSPIPGTTRDFIEERIIIGPYALVVTDTAGLHATDAELERLGIEKTLERVREADFFLVVVDSAEALPDLPAEALAFLTPERALVVENKIDLPGSRALPEGFLRGVPRARVSLRTGQGVEALRGLLAATLERDHVVPDETALVVSARHAAALGAARDALNAARAKLVGGSAQTELAAEDLRAAMDALGQVVGRIDNEAMLDRLFKTFCIGK